METDILHRVWSFSGVSPPLVRARFQPPHHRVEASYTYYDRCRLLPGHPACCHKGRFRMVRPRAGQISPDKDVNFRYATAAFTLSPESRASLCCANLPGDWALYAVSVRRLTALHSGFLQTVPRGSALAVG